MWIAPVEIYVETGAAYFVQLLSQPNLLNVPVRPRGFIKYVI